MHRARQAASLYDQSDPVLKSVRQNSFHAFIYPRLLLASLYDSLMNLT